MSSASRMRPWEADTRYPNGPRLASDLSEPAAMGTIGVLSPTSGTTAGGTTVTIAGTNFYKIAKVELAGNACVYTWVSATSLSIVTPAGTAGAKSLVITQTDGTSQTKASAYTYV